MEIGLHQPEVITLIHDQQPRAGLSVLNLLL
jgi:hypothetical protein